MGSLSNCFHSCVINKVVEYWWVKNAFMGVCVFIQAPPPQIQCPVTFRLTVLFFSLTAEMVVAACWQKRTVLNGGYCSINVRALWLEDQQECVLR